jgi:hypothetical protein
MRVLVLVAVAAFAAGCTSVRIVQRDGCWIKQTEKRPFKRVREEVGPCKRAAPTWAEDRLTRLVQECVAEADYRWHMVALESWSRGKPTPAQPSQDSVLRSCMEEARVGLVSENEELKRRLSETAEDRDKARTLADAERARSDQERSRFQESLDRTLGRIHDTQDKLAEKLGEAASKPAPPAVATANASSTSDGKATNESGTTLASESSSGSDAGAAPLPAVPAATQAAPAAEPPRAPVAPKAAARPPKVARARPPAPACDPPLVRASADAPCTTAAAPEKPEAKAP